MSEHDELPTVVRVGDAYAVRTFRAVNGMLCSVTQTGGFWLDGICEAICLADPEHVAPVDDCTCGVYAWYTLDKLEKQYGKWTRYMVAVIRMDGERLEAPNGVKAHLAQIVAWWVSEDASAELIEACVAGAPNTRRYHNRDVMLAYYPPPAEAAAAERRR